MYPVTVSTIHVHNINDNVHLQYSYDFIMCRFTCTTDREKAMEEVDKVRARSIYEHKVCSEECCRRGSRVLHITHFA